MFTQEADKVRNKASCIKMPYNLRKLSWALMFISWFCLGLVSNYFLFLGLKVLGGVFLVYNCCTFFLGKPLLYVGNIESLSSLHRFLDMRMTILTVERWIGVVNNKSWQLQKETIRILRGSTTSISYCCEKNVVSFLSQNFKLLFHFVSNCWRNREIGYCVKTILRFHF